jgi:stage II sporulation protein D
MMGLWMFQSWQEEKEAATEEILHNVYIVGVSGTAVTVIGDESRCYESAAAVSQGAVNSVVADVYIRNGEISKIVKKPEYVTGTIQKISDSNITVDEYGEVKLAEEFAVYCLSKDGAVSKGNTDDLKVGQTNVRFIAAGNEICAAIVPEASIDNIRVLLTDNDFSSYNQEKVVITATTDYTVGEKNKSTLYKKGEKLVLSADKMSNDVVVDTADKGKIRIESLKRQYGVPEYRGTIRVIKNGDSLYLINEVSIEEYLYSVVPSEMPTEYDMEALKAQAVCARSYATAQINGKRLAEYGAHVDDSVSFQVYNNCKEDSRSIAAVDATRNQIITYKGKTASAYFYSTSCGSSEGTKDVWMTKKDSAYLPTGNEIEKDLSDEKEFLSFISSKTESYDKDAAWYRWNTSISREDLKESLEKNLPSRCQANTSQIQVKQEDGSYRSETVKSIGDILNIKVKKRGRGGVISMVEITGSEKTIRVYTEYNIRMLFGGTKVRYKRNDGKTVNGLAALPSGYFHVEKKENQFIFTGGGFGHGVGMSQNGADAMGKSGKSWQDIILFYFPGTTVEDRGAALWK